MESNQIRSEGQVTNTWAKFAIGAVAGLCAAVLPRFLAQLSQSDISRITFFPDAYLIAAGVFAVFMGAIMSIFEWKVASKPRDTFMTALGLPAVVAGALGTASGVGSINDVKREADQLRRAISQQQGIVKQGTLGTFERLETLAPMGPGSVPKASGKVSWTPVFLIGSAYAQPVLAQTVRDQPIRYGIHVDEPKYIVVLKQAQTSEEAVRAAQEFRQRLPQAQAIKSGGKYYVILGNVERNETDAVLDAARAKTMWGHSNLQPQLVEFKK
jgi:hypothetical protein